MSASRKQRADEANERLRREMMAANGRSFESDFQTGVRFVVAGLVLLLGGLVLAAGWPWAVVATGVVSLLFGCRVVVVA